MPAPPAPGPGPELRFLGPAAAAAAASPPRPAFGAYTSGVVDAALEQDELYRNLRGNRATRKFAEERAQEVRDGVLSASFASMSGALDSLAWEGRSTRPGGPLLDPSFAGDAPSFALHTAPERPPPRRGGGGGGAGEAGGRAPRPVGHGAVVADRAHKKDLESKNTALNRSLQEGLKELRAESTARAAAEKHAVVAQARAVKAEQSLDRNQSDWQRETLRLEKANDKAAAELRLMETRLKEKEFELDRFRSEAHQKRTSLAHQAEGLKKVLAEHDQEIGVLREDLSSRIADNQSLVVQLNDLEARLAEAKQHKQELQDEVQELDVLLAEADEDRQHVFQKYSWLGKKVELLLAEEERTKEAAQRKTEEAERATAEARETQGRWLAEKAECERSIQDLGEKLKEVTEAKRKGHKYRKKKTRELQEEVDVLHAQLQTSQEARAELEAKLGEKEDYVHQVVADREAAVAALKLEVAQLQGTLESKESGMAAFRSAVEREARDRLEMEMRTAKVKHEARVRELEEEHSAQAQAELKMHQQKYQELLNSRIGEIKAFEKSQSEFVYATSKNFNEMVKEKADETLRRIMPDYILKTAHDVELKDKLAALQKSLEETHETRLVQLRAEHDTLLANQRADLQKEAFEAREAHERDTQGLKAAFDAEREALNAEAEDSLERLRTMLLAEKDNLRGEMQTELEAAKGSAVSKDDLLGQRDSAIAEKDFQIREQKTDIRNKEREIDRLQDLLHESVTKLRDTEENLLGIQSLYEGSKTKGNLLDGKVEQLKESLERNQAKQKEWEDRYEEALTQIKVHEVAIAKAQEKYERALQEAKELVKKGEEGARELGETQSLLALEQERCKQFEALKVRHESAKDAHAKELENRAQAHAMQVDALTAAKAALEHQLVDLTAREAERYQHLDETQTLKHEALEAEIEALKELSEEQKAALKEKDQRIPRLAADLGDREAEVKDLKEWVAELRGKLKEVERAQYERENRTSTKVRSIQMVATNKLHGMQQMKLQLEAEVKAEMSKFWAEFAPAFQKISMKHLDEVEKLRRDADRTRTGHEADLADAIARKMKEFAAEKEALLEKHGAELREQSQAVTALELKLQTAEAKVAELTALLDEREEELELLRKTRTDQQHALKLNSDMLDQSEADLKQRQLEMQRKEDERRDLAGKLDSSLANHAALVATFAKGLELSSEMAEGLKSDDKGVFAAHVVKLQHHLQAYADGVAADAAQAAQEAAQERVERLREEVGEKADEADELKHQTEVARQEVQRLTDALEGARAQGSQAEAGLQQARGELEKARKAEEEVARRVREESVELAELVAEEGMAPLRAELDVLRADYQELLSLHRSEMETVREESEHSLAEREDRYKHLLDLSEQRNVDLQGENRELEERLRLTLQ